VEIDGELRTTVEAEVIGKKEVNLSEDGVAGAKIKIVTVNNRGETITLAETVTDSGGNFDVEWKVEILGVDRVIHLIAVYDGNNQFQPAVSQRFSIVVRAAPLEVAGEQGNISVGVSYDPVVIRTGHLTRIDLEFHSPGSTSILDDVWYDFVVVQDARKIREEKNNFAGNDRSVFSTTDEIFTHFFTTRSNNELTVSIYLRGIGESESDFKPLNDLIKFTISPLGNREVGVILNSDKPEYFFGEPIIVKGRITSFESVPLIFQLKNPNGKICVSQILPSLNVDSNGNFQAKLRANENKCEEPGRYELTAFYGEQRVKTAFIVNAPSTTIDVIKRDGFSMIRVNNAPFADSVFELRLNFLNGKTITTRSIPPEWFSHFDSDKSMLIFFTDYDPITPSSSKIFRINNPSDTIKVEWFTVDHLGHVTGTGVLTLK
jgi:hypothetical protein